MCIQDHWFISQNCINNLNFATLRFCLNAVVTLVWKGCGSCMVLIFNLQHRICEFPFFSFWIWCLIIGFNLDDNLGVAYLIKDVLTPCNAVGGTLEHDRPSGSRSSDDSGCSSQKRVRKEDCLSGRFDLNLPAEVIDRNWSSTSQVFMKA